MHTVVDAQLELWFVNVYHYVYDDFRCLMRCLIRCSINSLLEVLISMQFYYSEFYDLLEGFWTEATIVDKNKIDENTKSCNLIDI